MTSKDFCFWLQGYFEIVRAGGTPPNLNVAQVDIIQRHLNMVFVHEIDPSFPAEQQQALNTAHSSPAWPQNRIDDDGETLVRC